MTMIKSGPSEKRSQALHRFSSRFVCALLLNASGSESQKPRADARGLLFGMGDPNDRLESRAGVLDLLDERPLYHGGARGIERGRRFYRESQKHVELGRRARTIEQQHLSAVEPVGDRER